MANLNDAMDTVQHNVRILSETLGRLDVDEAAREQARVAAMKVETAAQEIRRNLNIRWFDPGSGAGWQPE